MDQQKSAEKLQLFYLEKLIQSGEKDRLRELLRTRLVECGWRDRLKLHAQEIIQKRGLDHITVEELAQEIRPQGRATVPDEIKAELLQRIRKFLATAAS